MHHQGIGITIVCPGFIKTQVSVNALVGDGSVQNSMDDAQANAMLPEICAKKILKAVELKKEEINIGGKETFGVIIKRFCPRYFSKLIRKAKVT